MHILLNILLFLLTLSTSVFCHAQSSELHVTVVWDSFGRGSRLFPVGIFDMVSLMREALQKGIITIGGGGDNPRNVMSSPLSGADSRETFDVLPYAEAVSDYLLSRMTELHLPRKLKVAFSNTEENLTHANMRDLGFVANPDGTFSVPRPARPRTGSTTDGQRVLYSRVFNRVSGTDNPAIDFMEESGWAKTIMVDFAPGYALVLLDPDVHWSWKNGVYTFWKD